MTAVKRINLPKPVEIEAATKEAFFFETPRESQLESEQHVFNNMEDFTDFVIELPTGTGKSAILEGIMQRLKLEHMSSYYAVNRKGLQAQNKEDFGDRVSNIWGRNNYPCLCDGVESTIQYICPKKKCNRDCTAATAPCVTTHEFNCPRKKECPYRVAKEYALASSALLVNNQYLFAEHQHVGEFGCRDLFIMDETHVLESELMKLQEYVLTENMLKRLWEVMDIDEYKNGEITGTLLSTQKGGEPATFNLMHWHPATGISDSYDFKPIIKIFKSKIMPREDDPQAYTILMYECAVIAYKKLVIAKKELRRLTAEKTDALLMGYEEKDMKELYVQIEFVTKDVNFLTSIARLNGLVYNLIKYSQNWVVYVKGKCEVHGRVETLKDYCDSYIKGKKCGRKLENFMAMFKPVRVDFFAKPFLAELGEKKIYCSATIGDIQVFCKSLGIEKCLFIQDRKSPFAIKNRRIYYDPIGSMSYDNIKQTLELMPNKVEAIINSYQGTDLSDKRVLVLCWTRRIGAHLYANVRAPRTIPEHEFKALRREMYVWFGEKYQHASTAMLEKQLKQIRTSRVLFHMEDEIEREVAIKLYKLVPDAVLITTYLNTGFDGKDDLCRCIIICKVPFPNLGDKQIKARFEIDKKWYQNQTVVMIEQMCGRGVRSDTDWCINIILDSSFIRLWNYKAFSPVFTEAVVFAQR